MFQVPEAPLGTPNAHTHPQRCSRTRLAISSRSAVVQSACGPRTASSSIFSSVSMLPPNSRGSSLSSLATSPPRTSSTGDPDCASSKISVNCDGASSRKIFFTIAVWQPCTNNSSRLARVRWNAFGCNRAWQTAGQEKPTGGNEENDGFSEPNHNLCFKFGGDGNPFAGIQRGRVPLLCARGGGRVRSSSNTFRIECADR